MGEAATTGMENLTTAFSWITGNMDEVVSMIISAPILLLGPAIWMVGGALGLARRLMRG